MSFEDDLTIEGELRRFISDKIVQDVVSDDEPLISTGKFDSMDMILILDFIDESYGTVAGLAIPEDFESVKTLAVAIRRIRGGAGAAIGSSS
jgi:acyl carrier protein